MKSVLELALSIPERRRPPTEDVTRLVNAAAHLFFVKRGEYESAIYGGEARKRKEGDKGEG